MELREKQAEYDGLQSRYDDLLRRYEWLRAQAEDANRRLSAGLTRGFRPPSR